MVAVMLPYDRHHDRYSGPRVYPHLDRFSDYEIGMSLRKWNHTIVSTEPGGLYPPAETTLTELALNAYRMLGEPDCFPNPSQLGAILRMCHVVDFQHLGKFRRTGDPEAEHPIAAFRMAIDAGFHDFTLALGLLGHDEYEDSGVSKATIVSYFGPEVDFLIEGVTTEKERLGVLGSYNKLVWYASRDPRVYIVKLFDNGSNLKTVVGGNVEMDLAWQLKWLHKLQGPNREALLRCREIIKPHNPSLIRKTDPILECNMAEADRIERLLTPKTRQLVLGY